MLHKAVLCGLVVCCGLLAKWLRVSDRVRVTVRVRAGARECTSCTFFFFLFFLWPHFISVVNPVLVGSIYSLGKCARWVTDGYSIDDVTTWSWVNLATPLRANITRITRGHKAGEGLLSYSQIDKLMSGSSLEGKAF